MLTNDGKKSHHGNAENTNNKITIFLLLRSPFSLFHMNISRKKYARNKFIECQRKFEQRRGFSHSHLKLMIIDVHEL